jgi:hypothetical protein
MKKACYIFRTKFLKNIKKRSANIFLERVIGRLLFFCPASNNWLIILQVIYFHHLNFHRSAFGYLTAVLAMRRTIIELSEKLN